MKPLSLYLHIPFCVRKCAYCDFASEGGRQALIPDYVTALREEIADSGARWPGYQVKTVFFGGGTPSLLSGTQFESLMGAVRKSFVLVPDAEITLESNPGTLTKEKLLAYRQAGANRLSIGVQAFDDRLLRALGRVHTAAQAREAADMAREAGFENVNLDLMYGLPGQSMQDWTDTLHAALATGAPHLSLYSLIVEDGTPLAKRVAEGETLPGEEETLAMQHAAARILAQAGLTRYEVSNYARGGFECRHNLVYWERGEYLGLGCAAHSLMAGTRFANPARLERYLMGERAGAVQRLDREDELTETVMLSLRTRYGMDMENYRRLIGAAYSSRRRVVDRLIAEGMARERSGRLSLTERGMDVLNAVVEALI